MIERGDPLWVPSFHRTSDVSTFKNFLRFVAVRSSTADSGLLQPTGGVNTTPHTSIFHSESHAHAWLKFWVRTHSSHLMFHVSVVFDCLLFDNSIHFSFPTVFSLDTLSFLLPVNFIFQDVVDKFPVHFRWGRVPHHGGLWTLHPGILGGAAVPSDFDDGDVTIGKALSDACGRRADHSQEEGLPSCLSSSVSHDGTGRPLVAPFDSQVSSVQEI